MNQLIFQFTLALATADPKTSKIYRENAANDERQRKIGDVVSKARNVGL